MNRRALQLASLFAASLAGSVAIVLAGGGPALVDLLRLAERHSVILAILVAAWALIANCLVLPAGSLSLIAGGASLGMFVPTAIWFAAQLVTAPLLYRAGRVDRQRVAAIMRRYFGPSTANWVARAADDGVWTTVLLRLTPVMPSAPAALIAAATGITFKSVMLGSALAGWVRPLYFASLGASIGSIARVGTAEAALSIETLWPLVLVCACAAGMLGFRLWVGRRSANVLAARAHAPVD